MVVFTCGRLNKDVTSYGKRNFSYVNKLRILKHGEIILDGPGNHKYP